MIRAEAAERSLKAVALVDGPMGVIRGRLLSTSSQVVVASMGLATEPIAAGVDENAAEPGIEPIRVAEAMMVAPGSDECVVGCIFGLQCVAENEPGKAVALIEAAVEQPLEGLPSSRLGIDRESRRFVRQVRLRSAGACRCARLQVPTHQGRETFILRHGAMVA